ncbi:MAG: hypothetical protein JXA04_00475 [Gammaproteobacteria bacterium]|nr:hypothetical protein [Gammaproteobacteria bacterium]
MESNVVIGHLNIIRINQLKMGEKSYIGRMNIMNGPFSVELDKRASIGNRNTILRGSLGIVTYGFSELRLGELAKITSSHRIDCTQSVTIAAFSTMAGIGSQIWTHGYIHETHGACRYRVDGKVEIGHNVYIGSGCIISMGVNIASGVIVGAGVTVARNLDVPGLYVSAAIRQLPRPKAPEQRVDLTRVNEPGLTDLVYIKTPKS